MKIIGLIGGVSWQSSAEYYRLINQGVMQRLGAAHSAELIMYSLDFCPVVELEQQERWDELASLLIDAIKRLERAGADFVVIPSNTLHKVADQLEQFISIPLLHIADTLAEEIGKTRISTVGLLGTRFVMEQDFYRDKLTAHGVKVLTPGLEARKSVHAIIYDELCLGKVSDRSRERILKIIAELQIAGAEAIILANTELPLLIQADSSPVRLFDTMAIHASRAVELALEGRSHPESV
jgi:aspartate racemase